MESIVAEWALLPDGWARRVRIALAGGSIAVVTPDSATASHAVALTPDQVEAIAALAYVEMLEGGFTRAGEFHYPHHDRDGRLYAGIAELAGRIAAGHPADLVTFRPGELATAEGDGMLDEWIFAGLAPVEDVWVQGRRVVRAGRHVERDAAVAGYRRAMRELVRA